MTKDQTKMVHLTDDWYLGTDGLSFVLLKQREVRAGRQTKQENIGSFRYDTMGYYATLQGVVSGLYRYMSMDVLMQTKASELIGFIEELDAKIERVDAVHKEMLEKLKERLEIGE